MDSHPITIITSCSVSRTIVPKVQVKDMPVGLSMREGLDWWTNALKEHEASITPREQYRGLGFSTLVKVQEAHPEVRDIQIVTGGLGLTDLDIPIVPYDFTADKNEEHNIWQKVTKEPFVQTVWWSMINEARHQNKTPIAYMVAQRPNERFLIACSKVFLRYIAEDLLSIPLQDRQRVRIMLAASSINSVPMQLRPMMVPFDRGAISHLPGNRNDGNHRAALQFLNIAKQHREQDQDFWAKTPQDQARFFADESTNGHAAGKIMQGKLRDILQSNPVYLQMDCEAAYKQIRREHGALGGRMGFRALFRELGGAGPVLQEVEMSDEDQKKAQDAMAGLGFLTATTQVVASDNEEDLAIQGVQRFLTVLKGVKPDAIFTAADVAQWAERYYENGPPAFLKSPSKAIHILKNNTDVLGLKEVAVSSGKAYQLVPVL